MSPSSTTPPGGAASPEGASAQPTDPAEETAASSLVWRVVLPLAYSVMEAQPVALLGLFILLETQNTLIYAPLSLLALTIFAAGYVWLAMLSEVARGWMRPRGLDGFVITGYVLLWVAGFIVSSRLQFSVFFPAPVTFTTNFYSPDAQASAPTFGLGVTVTAICLTWLYIRAIRFASVSAKKNEQTHKWLLSSFKWELVVFAGLLVVGAGVTDKATYYTTSLIALPLFVVGGLVAVALARQATLVRSKSYATPTAAPQTWYRWLGVFAAVAIGALILFEALFLSGALAALLAAIAPVVNATGSALGHLFSALGSGLKGHPSQATPPPAPSQGGTTTTRPQTAPPSQTAHGGAVTISATLAIILAVGFEMALLVGAFLLALWRRRLRADAARAPLRRFLGIVMWVLLALAIVFPILIALLILSALIQSPRTSGGSGGSGGGGSGASAGGASGTPGGVHSITIPLPGGNSLVIQLPFSLPSLGGAGSGGTTSSGGATTGTSTANPSNPAATHKQSTGNPLAILLLILEIIAAVGILAAVIALVVLAMMGVRMFLRSRRARRTTSAPTLDDATAVAQPTAALRGDAARLYYRRLLQAAAEVGGEYARQPAETPREYALRLNALLARPDAPTQLRRAAAPVGLGAPHLAPGVTNAASPANASIAPNAPSGVAVADAPAPADEETRIALDELTSAYRIARYRGDPTDDARAARLRSWLTRLLSALGA